MEKSKMLFETLDQVKASIAFSYSKWVVLPSIEIERSDYVCWRVPDGSIIEAFQDYLYNEPSHL
jgi:hypothetical protein